MAILTVLSADATRTGTQVYQAVEVFVASKRGTRYILLLVAVKDQLECEKTQIRIPPQKNVINRFHGTQLTVYAVDHVYQL